MVGSLVEWRKHGRKTDSELEGRGGDVAGA